MLATTKTTGDQIAIPRLAIKLFVLLLATTETVGHQIAIPRLVIKLLSDCMMYEIVIPRLAIKHNSSFIN
jgi:hypothetical protein